MEKYALFNKTNFIITRHIAPIVKRKRVRISNFPNGILIRYSAQHAQSVFMKVVIPAYNRIMESLIIFNGEFI